MIEGLNTKELNYLRYLLEVTKSSVNEHQAIYEKVIGALTLQPNPSTLFYAVFPSGNVVDFRGKYSFDMVVSFGTQYKDIDLDASYILDGSREIVWSNPGLDYIDETFIEAAFFEFDRTQDIRQINGLLSSSN